MNAPSWEVMLDTEFRFCFFTSRLSKAVARASSARRACPFLVGMVTGGGVAPASDISGGTLLVRRGDEVYSVLLLGSLFRRLPDLVSVGELVDGFEDVGDGLTSLSARTV